MAPPSSIFGLPLFKKLLFITVNEPPSFCMAPQILLEKVLFVMVIVRWFTRTLAPVKVLFSARKVLEPILLIPFAATVLFIIDRVPPFVMAMRLVTPWSVTSAPVRMDRCPDPLALIVSGTASAEPSIVTLLREDSWDVSWI